MTRYEDVVLNQYGAGISGAAVSVYLQGTGTLATLYADDAGTSRTNPTAADSLGRFWFYIADGKYDLEVSGTGLTTYKQLDVEISDVTEATTGDTAWLVRKLNNTRFAAQFVGADAGAKIANAIADLPSTGGTVDARGLEGAQTTAATITLNKPVDLLLGHTTLTGGAAANPVILVASNDVSIKGRGWNSTVIQTATAANSGITSATYVRGRIKTLQIQQTAGAPTGTGIRFSGPAVGLWTANTNIIEDVLVTGFQDGIVIFELEAAKILTSRSTYNARDGIRLIGSNVALHNTWADLNDVITAYNGANGLLIDGYGSGISIDYLHSLANDTGIRVQTVVGTGTPGQLWFKNCLADSNTTNGWYITTGDQIVIEAPWSSNRGGTNFYLSGVTDVLISKPVLFNFKGHGIELHGSINVNIQGGYCNDFNQNPANTKDCFNADAASAGFGIEGGFWGNANLRYTFNLAAGSTVYRIHPTSATPGTSGMLNEPTPAAERTLIGIPGITSVFSSTIAGDYGFKVENPSATGYGLRIHNGLDANEAFAISNAAGTANKTAINGLGVANFARVKASTGTTLAAGDFALSAAWGTTAAVSAVTGTDQGWNITVTCGGTGIAANPTSTLTFKDGTWTSSPVVISKMVGGTGTITDLTEPPADQTPTTWKITFNGTPVDTKTYIISGIVMGR